MAGDEKAPPRPKSRILEWLEVLAKLVGASAVLVVALFREFASKQADRCFHSKSEGAGRKPAPRSMFNV